MNVRTRLFTAAAAVSLLGAVAAFAQDLPAPNPDNTQAVLKWARDSKITDNTANPAAAWNTLAAIPDGILSFTVQAPPDAQKVAKAGVRLERFRPASGVRSDASFYDIDCGKQQYKTTMDASFPEHNFGGAKIERTASPAWTPIAQNEIVAAIKDEACKARTVAVATAPVAMAADGRPASMTDVRQIRTWMNANNVQEVNPGGRYAWTVLHGDPQGLLLVGMGSVNVETQEVNVVLRRELWQPANNAAVGPVLSELTEYEVACRTNRMRKLSFSQHASRNLLGKSDGVRKTEPWVPFAGDAVLGKQLEGACKDLKMRQGSESKMKLR